jgi:hypothetical protein
MNLVKSANDRAKESAMQREQEARMKAHIAQERMNIRVNLIQAAKEPEKAKAAWNIIKNKDYPEITIYGQAAFVMLKNDEVPTVEKLDVIAEYLKQD